MDVTVRTGQTKAPRDTNLLCLDLASHQGERVCLLVEVIGKGKEVKVVEREAETIVGHSLLDTDGDAGERLDGTLKELNGLLKGLLVSGAIEDIHMVIAIVDTEGELHVSHAGRAEAYLVRKGVASQVTEYSSGKPVPAFVHISSGKLEEGDRVLLSTQRLLRTLTPAQMAQIAGGDEVVPELARALESDGEHAALASLIVAEKKVKKEEELKETKASRMVSRERRRGAMDMASSLKGLLAALPPKEKLLSFWTKGMDRLRSSTSAAKGMKGVRARANAFVADLSHPKRKRKAHLLLLACAVAALLIIWALVHVVTSSQRGKTEAELEILMEQITQEVQTAENRRIIGDIDAANAILDRAEERAKQVMDNESGLFRVEALDLLDRIRSKKEEINNIVRLSSPRVVANVSAKTPDVSAEGIIGLAEGEFIVYDRQDLYRILLNSIEDPQRISEEELILDGSYLDRFQTLAFLVTGNSLVEVSGSQVTSMKTEDPAGWVTGKDIEAYLRFLYVLSPEKKQIYKYERLSGRYSTPVSYNVNGDLTGALDMAIDGNVYILKEDGTLLKLFRGEAQPFVIRRSPEGVLKNTTKVFKNANGNFYLLDPTERRIVVLSDGGATGESSYLRQYVLEGEQVGELKDLYVDPEDTRLYVLDEKRVYVIDVAAR